MFPLQTLRLYPFLKLAIALILGMWLATGVDILLSWQWALAFVAVTIITLFLRRPLLQSLLLLFSVFLLGGTLMTRQMESIGDGYAADETIFDAVVASQPVMKKKVMQMDLWITSASEPKGRKTEARRWHQGKGTIGKTGQLCKINIRLSHLSAPTRLSLHGIPVYHRLVPTACFLARTFFVATHPIGRSSVASAIDSALPFVGIIR